jgi:hypothetical protein
MPRKQFNPAPASPVAEDSLLVEVNRRFDALINTFLHGGWYDPAELAAVLKRREELLESLERR